MLFKTVQILNKQGEKMPFKKQVVRKKITEGQLLEVERKRLLKIVRRLKKENEEKLKKARKELENSKKRFNTKRTRQHI